jgi:hypothetical protein
MATIRIRRPKRARLVAILAVGSLLGATTAIVAMAKHAWPRDVATATLQELHRPHPW